MTIVRTALGALEGTTAATRRGNVEVYLGVPFAGGTVRRFRAPEPVEPWAGIRDATSSGPAAPQNDDPIAIARGIRRLPSAEGGCLNLNIWTPKADGARRPVMLWAHGGAYLTGSNADESTSGAELADALDVVVVAANYRLGALGFLTLDHLLGSEFEDASNLAVLDQLAALRWIRAHIDRFGGDPAQVTIFGQSAGAALVGTILGTPDAAGLFQRAIMQSGTAERARSLQDSRAVTAELLAALGLRENQAEQLLEVDIDELLAAQAEVVAEHSRRTVGLAFPFQPTFGTRVLPDVPVDAVGRGVNANVDLVAGTNVNESSFFTVMRPRSADADFGTMARSLIGGELGPGAFDDYVQALAIDSGRSPSDDDVLESALTDRTYRQPTNRLLEARLASASLTGASGRTFAYLFTWPSPLMDGALGSCHTLETPFVFRQLHRQGSASLTGKAPPGELSDSMSHVWAAFARHGMPLSAALPDWPEYDAVRRSTMILDRQPVVREDPRGALRRIWFDRQVSSRREAPVCST